MSLVKLMIGLLAFLGAAYFTILVPLGDGRTLGSHVMDIARSDEARQLGAAVGGSVSKATQEIVQEVGKVGASSSKAGKNAEPRPKTSAVPSESLQEDVNPRESFDRKGLRRLIAGVAKPE
jgi:general stress protein YciG